MTNIKKTLSIFLVLILAISLFSFTVFASNEVNSPEIDPETPQVEPVDPVQPTDPQPQEYEQEIIDYDYEGNGNDGFVENFVNPDDNAAQSGEVVADNNTEKLYDTSDIDANALKENTWSDISLTTQKVDNDDAGDFTAITENNEKGDNSTWILYTGIVLIAVSLLGILYFVAATVSYRKKLKKLRAREMRNNQRRPNPTSRQRISSDVDSYHSRVNTNERPRSYSTSPRLSNSDKRRMKADTAEVYIPRRFADK